MSKSSGYNAMDMGGHYAGKVGSHSLHRSFTSPDRRVIFPSLHGACSPSYSQPKPVHEQPYGVSMINFERKERGDSVDISPTDVQSATTKPVLRANSLDGILIPLPKLSLAEDSKSNAEFAPIAPKRSLSLRASVQYPIRHANIQSTPTSKWPAHPSRSGSPLIFGEAIRHKTYYPAATIPTPISDRKPPSHSKPLSSILRRKLPIPPTQNTSQQGPCNICDGTSGTSSTSSPNEGGSVVSSPQPSHVAISPSLSPAVPTLASPASIKSLQSRDNGPHPSDSEGRDGIGESVKHISDLPKIKMLPRKQCPLRRNQSDSIVGNNEEEHSKTRSDSIVSERSVSRHVSLEEMANNKRISFDPHITVYEFRVSDYERKGGKKWFSEDELTQFKQEAIQRIRLRSTKVIPTGTGRALTVATKREHDNKGGRGRASPVNSKPNGCEKSKGSVSFNHPALGCEEEIDPESQNSRESTIQSYLSQEIRNILVVDTHEIFLGLFTKSLKHMIPHASVATARSAEEAISRIEAAKKAFPQRDGGSTHGFDIIVTEERLRGSISVQQLASGPQHTCESLTRQQGISTQTAGDDSIQRRWLMTSGSTLIRHLVESQRKINNSRGSLFVGVSARLNEDREKLEKAGADCVWGKPPPKMNSTLRNNLLKLLMEKRGNRTDI